MRCLNVFRLLFFIIITFFCTSGMCFASIPENNTDSHIHEIAENINSRTKVMKDVAAYKWVHNLPISDPKREKIVLENISSQAQKMGLTSDSVVRFYQILIKVAKIEQEKYFSKWKKTGFDYPNFKDLKTVVRPEILRLDSETLIEIKELILSGQLNFKKEVLKSIFINYLSSQYFTTKQKEALFEALG